ncbi:MAG: sugar phosphate isomerase/epimerase [Desulfobacteraceae bacterium]|nr:sugar phosphate isomerase/epimerase [Desulfobacteraceae bacterium]
MKIGFNLLLWTTHVTEEHFSLLEKLKRAGYDGVEVSVFEGDRAHFEKVSKVLKDNGLASTVVTVIPDEMHNPISSKAKHREEAFEYLKWAMDCAQSLDSKMLCGPFYQPLGVFSGQGPTEEEKKHGAEVHRKAAEYALQADIMLAVEPLNRFESYFLNTVDDAADYTRRVGHSHFGILYDTFHANIEEQDPIGCIGRNIEQIRHVHISENDRGMPGKGHIDWPATFKVLRSAGYDGWLTIEAFSRALPDLAAATRVWRDFFDNPQEVYTESINFVKEQWAAAG